MRKLTAVAAPLAVAVTALLLGVGPVGQAATCSPVGTPTCDPNGNPIGPGNPGGPSTVPSIAAATGTVQLGGGKAVTGAEGIAYDAKTGLVYIGLNGTIVSGCEGDPARGGSLVAGPGAHQLSIVNPATKKEVAAVATGQAPIWPTVDSARGLVYVMGSGDGTVNVHRASDGVRTAVITVGGKPHMGGLDTVSGLMVVGNTVRASQVVAEQNYATIVNTKTNTVVKDFVTSPAPHGMVVDAKTESIYFSAVGDGAIVKVDGKTGNVVASSIPNLTAGTGFGNNNMLARQAKTGRLFQANAQQGAMGILVVDEKTLKLHKVVTLPVPPWGMSVDEGQQLLFAALPNQNVVAVIDLKTLTHVANIPVGTCPYAVVVDPKRKVGVTSNQGSPTQSATATTFSLCTVYKGLKRKVKGC